MLRKLSDFACEEIAVHRWFLLLLGGNGVLLGLALLAQAR